MSQGGRRLKVVRQEAMLNRWLMRNQGIVRVNDEKGGLLWVDY